MVVISLWHLPSLLSATQASLDTTMDACCSYLVGHGATLYVVLPDERLSEDPWWRVVEGTDGKQYDRKKVIRFASIMMVILGSVLILLACIILLFKGGG